MAAGLTRLVLAALVPAVTFWVTGEVGARPAVRNVTAARPAEPQCTPASTLEQRAALPLVVGLPGVTQSSDPVVTTVLSAGVGGVLITQPNVKSSEQVGQLITDLKARAARPIVVATGDESGRVATFRDVIGATPSARELARTRTPDAVRGFAQATGEKLRATGVGLVLAPVVDLDSGPATDVIGDRSFSDDPETASRYGLAWAYGLTEAGLVPTAKHFPGHGRAEQDSHLGLPRVTTSLDELKQTDLKPFATLIDAGVPVVMTEHVAYSALDPNLPASLSPRAYELLREMRFQGVAITDSLTMGGITLRHTPRDAAVMAIAAGADSVLTTDGSQAGPMRDAIVAAVRSGRLPEARLNEAAARMIALAGGDPTPATCVRVRLPHMSEPR